jgi:hypothetical protein
MRWLLRVTAGIMLLWAVGLVAGRPHLAPPDQVTPLVSALANGLAATTLVFAFLFWRASSDTPPNRTAIYAAILLLLLKTGLDLHELLVLRDGVGGLVSVADLVVSVALTVGVIEALPATLRPQ